MKRLKLRGAWLIFHNPNQNTFTYGGRVPTQQWGIKPSCRDRGGGRAILFSAKDDPQSNAISRNSLLLFQAISVHVPTIARQSSCPWKLDRWLGEQPEPWLRWRLHREENMVLLAHLQCPPLWAMETCCYTCLLVIPTVSDDCQCLWFTYLSQQPRREGNIPWKLEQALPKFTVPLSLRLHLPTHNFALFFLSPYVNGNWIPSLCQPFKLSSSSGGTNFVCTYVWIFLSHSKYKQFTTF